METKNKSILILNSLDYPGPECAAALAKRGFNLTLQGPAEKANGLSKLVSETSKKHEVQCFGVAADLSEKNHVERLYKETIKKHSRLDGVVNLEHINTGGFYFNPDKPESSLQAIQNINKLTSRYLINLLCAKPALLSGGFCDNPVINVLCLSHSQAQYSYYLSLVKSLLDPDFYNSGMNEIKIYNVLSIYEPGRGHDGLITELPNLIINHSYSNGYSATIG